MAVHAKRRFVLTGPPGIGKTTVVKNVCSALQELSIPVSGFYTEELRKNGQRIGFDVVDINGGRCPLARIDDGGSSKYRVGRYSVLLKEFESMVIPIFQRLIPNEKRVIVIDEIGKMEMFSHEFKMEVNKLFGNDKNIMLITIPIAKGKPIQLVESIRNDKRNEIINIDVQNRNKILEQLINSITKL